MIGHVRSARLLAALLLAAPLMAARAQAAAPQVQVAPKNAADSLLEAQTTEVAKGLRCPVCQGLSIQDSPSELSQQMRDLVRDQLRSGKSPEEVRAYFISKYGEWILLAPKPTGFNLVAYAAPALLFLGGLAFIAFIVRRWTAVPPSEAAPSVENPDGG